MNPKDNFSQAVKDLLTSDAPAASAESAGADTSTPMMYTRPGSFAPAGVPQQGGNKESTGVSTIAAGTMIVGDIHSKGDLAIYGDVQGNIETSGNVAMGGKVIGNITGRDIAFGKSSVKGNLKATGNVQLDGKSVLMGDIEAKSVSSNGRIKGNLVIEGKAHFLPETILMGNVCAGSLSIEEGARIKGDVSTSSQNDADIDDPFKDL